jgi:hypothetical protein
MYVLLNKQMQITKEVKIVKYLEVIIKLIN